MRSIVFMMILVSACEYSSDEFEQTCEFNPNPNLRRIYSGEPVQESYENVLRLRLVDSKRMVYSCSSVLISPTKLLTASHCFESPDQDITKMTVRDNSDQVIAKVSDFVMRNPAEKFNPDIAIVTLDRELNSILPADLPVYELETCDSVVIVGYGRTETEHLPKRLFIGDSFVINTYPLKYELGGPMSTPCFGDSGGPMLTGNTLHGIFSTTKGCSLDYEFMYTKVISHLEWINQELGK